MHAQPSITLGPIGLYEEGDDADEDLFVNLPKILASCPRPGGGIQDNSVLSIEDFSQDLELRVSSRGCPFLSSFSLHLNIYSFSLPICVLSVFTSINLISR